MTPAGGGHGTRRDDAIWREGRAELVRRHRGHASRLGGLGAGGDGVVPAAVAASSARPLLPLAGHRVRLSATVRWRRTGGSLPHRGGLRRSRRHHGRSLRPEGDGRQALRSGRPAGERRPGARPRRLPPPERIAQCNRGDALRGDRLRAPRSAGRHAPAGLRTGALDGRAEAVFPATAIA